ncbi:MAG: sigma 54-interacting transcriptional regulator, partial [Desulfarculaceae bacterium]|nr:sigma 54-interacting transcriptional regulator [Desulfarculaceae bacterium]
MFRVLLAESEPAHSQTLERLLIEQGLRVSQAANMSEALAEVVANPPDLVIVAAALPPEGGLELLKRLKQDDPRLPVIVTAAGGATAETIEATKLGAFDYMTHPLVPADFAKLVHQALDAGRFMRSPVQMNQGQEITAGDALLGHSRPMQELYKAIGRAAGTGATVLIQGESGTGKELVARALFQHSARADKPFVVVNCVAIPETLLESELFGYEKGAFTGAASRRIGKIEQADGGTVFLDEIGDMPL